MADTRGVVNEQGDAYRRRSGDGGLEVRVERLESNLSALQGHVTEIATNAKLQTAELSHVKELLSTQFTQLHQGIELTRTRIHELANQMQTTFSDPAASAVGRTLVEDVTDLRIRMSSIEKDGASRENRLGQVEKAVVSVTTELHDPKSGLGAVNSAVQQAMGAIKFAQLLGGVGLGGAIAAIVRAAS